MLAEIVCLCKPTYDPFTPPNVTQHYRAIFKRPKLCMLVRQGSDEASALTPLGAGLCTPPYFSQCRGPHSLSGSPLRLGSF